jgi:hypothetical protein
VTPTDHLAQFALRLKNVAPQEWDAFVACFDAYALGITVAVIHADQNSVLNMQGKAVMVNHLLTTFRDCAIPPKPKPPSAPTP